MAIAPVIAARSGGDVALVECVRAQVVDACGDRVAAKHVGQAEPQVAGLVVVAWIADLGQRLRIGDRRAAIERRILVGHAADVGEVRVVAHGPAVVHRGHLAVHGIEREAVGEVAGVLGRPHVAAQLGVAGECPESGVLHVLVVVLVDRSRCQPLLGRPGQFQQVAVVDVPVDLGVPLRVVDLVVLRGSGIHAVDDVAALAVAFDRGEHEQLVLDQRAAHVGVIGRRPITIVAVGVVQLPRHGRRRQAAHVVGVVLARTPVLRGVDHLGTEVPFVGAALADHVDHATVGAAVLGAVAAGVGLFLVDGAVRQGDAALGVERIGGVEAVDVVRVLRGRRTAEADQRFASRAGRAAGSGDRARRQQCSGLGRSRQRQPGQFLRGDDGARIHRTHVDRRHGARRHVHTRQLLRVRGAAFGAEGNVHAHADLQRHVVTPLHFLAVAQQGDRIGVHGKLGRVVPALAVDADRAGQAGAVADHHALARLHRHATEDAAGGGLPVGGGGCQEHGQRRCHAGLSQRKVSARFHDCPSCRFASHLGKPRAPVLPVSREPLKRRRLGLIGRPA